MRSSLINCLIALQILFAAEMREYSVTTEFYPKIMAIVEVENISLDEDGFKELFGERIPFVESSLGLPTQLVGDDGASVGAYQNNIRWSLMRQFPLDQFPLGWTVEDSVLMATDLIANPARSQDEAQETFLEHLRYWRNKYGKTGDRLLRLSVRSYNRGLDYYAAMDSLGTSYVNKVVPGYGE